jgi:hypothetical protein
MNRDNTTVQCTYGLAGLWGLAGSSPGCVLAAVILRISFTHRCTSALMIPSTHGMIQRHKVGDILGNMNQLP